MNTVVLQVETELDPTAAPRVFGYLGGLGHIPLQAALRRGKGQALLMEVHFESPVPAAERISAKVEQMPFVLNSCIASGNPSAEGSGPDDGENKAGPAPQRPEGMGHSPVCAPRVDVMALRFAASQRGQAIRHRVQIRLNA